MAILRKVVDSTVVKTVVYDTSRSVLVVIFNSTSMWAYMDVPIDVYDDLTRADSVGRYFNLHIRNFYEAHKYIPEEIIEQKEMILYGEEE